MAASKHRPTSPLPCHRLPLERGDPLPYRGRIRVHRETAAARNLGQRHAARLDLSQVGQRSVLHDVRSTASQMAYVSCGQGGALVPASMRLLAPDNVMVRPLKERVMVVTAALAWDASRHHPMGGAMREWAERTGARQGTAEQAVDGKERLPKPKAVSNSRKVNVRASRPRFSADAPRA